MKRGQVYYADLGQGAGCEQSGNRPCVIIQNDVGNYHSPTVIVSPITTKNKRCLPTHVETTGEDKKLFIGNIILTEQIRTIDKDKLGDFICNLSKETIQKLDEALKISLALNNEERKEEEQILNELIHIGDSDISVKEYNGQRVVTFKDIDDAHNRPDGTARKRFNDNKKHFVEGEDFFVRKTDEAKREFGIAAPNGLTLITESGYLMLVKSFTDDTAWDVQRQLVNSYFRSKKLSQAEMMRIQLEMIDNHEERLSGVEKAVENIKETMTIDYGRQRALKKEVENTVVNVLGCEDSQAYKKMSRKVFSECNHDVREYFHVNSRNNIPYIRFEEVVQYIKSWKPCENTMMQISDCNKNNKTNYRKKGSDINSE